MYAPLRNIVSSFYKPRQPEQWVFVVGCYNSGTTLVREILGSHPDIETLPREGVRFTDILPAPEELGWTRMWVGCVEHMKLPESYGDTEARKIQKDWSPLWGRKGNVFLEKSITNITRMEWLDSHFKNAKFIGIVRNGYAVSEGIRRRAAPCGPVKEIYPSGYSIDMAGEQWLEANKCLLDSHTQVAQYHQITYEDLTADPYDVVAGIMEFIGVSPEVMRKNGDILNISSNQFSIGNRNEGSIGRLSCSDIESLNETIGAMMERLNYEKR